ncbi:hypothetical protein O181_022259 [Austropuccinia psidii MF-1]|uniref:Uncharacterized protein n=1 Tax=Austropuccinia psidii MF-1 TaxID=1389203 RepID=A0A9Q3GXH5_9BASI|nr:hypothetical protein [Austropuccinia psidii MF-1]
MPGQPPGSFDSSLCGFRLQMLHMQSLTLVQVPKNSNNCLCQGTLPKIHKQILMLVKVPDTSHTHPYTCAGLQQFRPFLTPGQPPDNSKNSLHD